MKGGRVSRPPPKSHFFPSQNALSQREDHHHHHGTKPGSIEGGRLRRVLEQSGNHGLVSAGRVERDGEENWRRVVRRDGVRDRAARRDGDVRFSCRRRFRRRLFLCARSFAGGVVSSLLSLPSVVRRDVYRRDGKRESKTVPESAIASLSLKSWLESQESDRKHLSLSLSLSLEQVRGELQRTRETRPQILNNNARRRRRNSARVYLCIVYKNVAVVKACKEHSKTASRARTKRHLE